MKTRNLLSFGFFVVAMFVCMSTISTEIKAQSLDLNIIDKVDVELRDNICHQGRVMWQEGWTMDVEIYFPLSFPQEITVNVKTEGTILFDRNDVWKGQYDYKGKERDCYVRFVPLQGGVIKGNGNFEFEMDTYQSRKSPKEQYINKF